MKTKERDPRQIAPKTSCFSVVHLTLAESIRQQRARAHFAAEVANHGIVEVRPGDSILMDPGEERFLELARRRPIPSELRAKFIERGQPFMILPNMATQDPAERTLQNLYDLLGRAVLITIPRGKKGPTNSGWQKITFEQTQSPIYQRELVETTQRGGNIGVRLGSVSDGLVAIDLDDDRIADHFLDLNPELRLTLRSRGCRGFQLWIRPRGNYPNSQAYYNLKDPAGRKYGEWRCGGVGRRPKRYFRAAS